MPTGSNHAREQQSPVKSVERLANTSRSSTLTFDDTHMCTLTFDDTHMSPPLPRSIRSIRKRRRRFIIPRWAALPRPKRVLADNGPADDGLPPLTAAPPPGSWSSPLLDEEVVDVLLLLGTGIEFSALGIDQ